MAASKDGSDTRPRTICCQRRRARTGTKDKDEDKAKERGCYVWAPSLLESLGRSAAGDQAGDDRHRAAAPTAAPGRGQRVTAEGTARFSSKHKQRPRRVPRTLIFLKFLF